MTEAAVWLEGLLDAGESSFSLAQVPTSEQDMVLSLYRTGAVTAFGYMGDGQCRRLLSPEEIEDLLVSDGARGSARVRFFVNRRPSPLPAEERELLRLCLDALRRPGNYDKLEARIARFLGQSR